MSNKLIKNRNSNSKELEYYKNHCALLKKQLEDEKKKRIELEIALSFDSKDNNELLKKLKELLISTEIAKNTYEELTKEVQKKKQELDDMLIKVKKFILHTQRN